MDVSHQRLAYILISAFMFLPVLLWPAPLLFFENPMLEKNITPTWFLSSSLFLLTIVSIDSMLYGLSNRKQAFDAMLWVSLFTIITISALQNHNNTWTLAILFLIHSLRSGYRLFMNSKLETDWWLWLAWSRDILTSLVIFFWVNTFKAF